MTGIKIGLAGMVVSSWGVVAQTALPLDPGSLSDQTAHGLLAVIASLSIGLAWWSIRKAFAETKASNEKTLETMGKFTDSINKLSDELRSRPCYYLQKKDD